MTGSSDVSSSTKSTGSAYLLFAICLALVVSFGLAMQWASLPFGLLGTEVLLIGLPAVIYVRLKRRPIAEALRWRRVDAGIAARSILLGPLAWAVATAASVLIGWLLKPILGSPPETALPVDTWAGFVLVLFVGALAPGVCEEMLFRGAIQGTLERRGARHAVIVTALLFAAFHLNPWDFLPIVGIGILFGILTMRTGSTVPAMTCHACVNATAYTFAFVFDGRLGEHQAELVLLGIGGVSTIVLAAVVVEFLRRTARLATRPSPLASVPAGVSRRFLRIAGVTSAAVVVLLLVGFRAFLGLHRMSTDALEPDVRPGDRVLVLKNRFFDVTIRPGDIVSFRRDGKLFLRKVARIDDAHVWVIEKSPSGEPSETPIPRVAVTGRMIRKLPAENRDDHHRFRMSRIEAWEGRSRVRPEIVADSPGQADSNSSRSR